MKINIKKAPVAAQPPKTTAPPKVQAPPKAKPKAQRTKGEEDGVSEVVQNVNEKLVKGLDPTERMRLARKAMDEINKKYKSKVVFGSEMPLVPRIRTHWLGFDYVTGGGFPRGRMSQIKGPNHCGKTTILLDTGAQVQRSGELVMWAQGEEFDKRWAERRGLDPSQVFLIPKAPGNVMLEEFFLMLMGSPIAFGVVDSLQSIKSARAMKEVIGEGGYGSGNPQMWGQWVDKVGAVFASSPYADDGLPAVVWVSQMRVAALGQWQPRGAETHDGTQIQSVGHAKSIDVRFSPRGQLRVSAKDKPYGREIALKCEKNKAGPQSQRTTKYHYAHRPLAELNLSIGVDKANDVLVLGRALNIIGQQGHSYFWNGQKIAGKLEDLVAWLHDPHNEERMLTIADQIYAASMVENDAPMLDDDDDGEVED